MKISDLATAALERPCVVNGTPCSIRMLLDVETAALHGQYPLPRLPKGDPKDGSYKRDLELYEADRERRNARLKAATVGIALGLSNARDEAWTPSRDREWVAAYAEELREVLGSEQLVYLYAYVTEILPGQTLSLPGLIGDEKKADASSSPSPTPGPSNPEPE